MSCAEWDKWVQSGEYAERVRREYAHDETKVREAVWVGAPRRQKRAWHATTPMRRGRRALLMKVPDGHNEMSVFISEGRTWRFTANPAWLCVRACILSGSQETKPCLQRIKEAAQEAHEQ